MLLPRSLKRAAALLLALSAFVFAVVVAAAASPSENEAAVAFAAAAPSPSSSLRRLHHTSAAAAAAIDAATVNALLRTRASFPRSNGDRKEVAGPEVPADGPAAGALLSARPARGGGRQSREVLPRPRVPGGLPVPQGPRPGLSPRPAGPPKRVPGLSAGDGGITDAAARRQGDAGCPRRGHGRPPRLAPPSVRSSRAFPLLEGQGKEQAPGSVSFRGPAKGRREQHRAHLEHQGRRLGDEAGLRGVGHLSGLVGPRRGILRRVRPQQGR